MRVVIVGRASGALAEYAEARAMCAFDATVVVGKMGEVFPDPIDYWATFHANLLDRWAAQRALRELPPATHYWGASYKGRNLGEGATACRPITFVPSVGGSSGFLAVQGALDLLGADRIVLAGMPMTREAGHETSAAEAHEVGRQWREANAYWGTWLERRDLIVGRVRSMSGRTRELLGAPTWEWLGGGARGCEDM